MRPLSHGITAVYLFLLYTERNEAVKSWDNGRFLFLVYMPNETRPLFHDLTAVFNLVVICTDKVNGLKIVAVYRTR